MGILLSVLGRGGGSSSDANIPQVTLDFEREFMEFDTDIV